MSKMTDKEIIKALEFCGHCVCNDDKTETECPLYNMSFCKNYLRKQSLDLINRQQAEIERLNKNISAMATTLSNSARGTRAEAIKEYKEKLREHAYLDSGITGFQEMVVDLSDIENIADEMVGADNGKIY